LVLDRATFGLLPRLIAIVFYLDFDKPLIYELLPKCSVMPLVRRKSETTAQFGHNGTKIKGLHCCKPLILWLRGKDLNPKRPHAVSPMSARFDRY